MPFSRAQLDELVNVAASGIERLVEFQRSTLAGL
jgi:ribonuclease PH